MGEVGKWKEMLGWGWGGGDLLVDWVRWVLEDVSGGEREERLALDSWGEELSETY